MEGQEAPQLHGQLVESRRRLTTAVFRSCVRRKGVVLSHVYHLSPFPPGALCTAWGVSWLCWAGFCQWGSSRTGVKPLCERNELLAVNGLMAADQQGGDLQIRWLMLSVSDWTFCRIPVV